ncbi:MAG: elongation factor 1-beta [Candidatus Nanohaloarchaeota archaeon QJJ-7]|nr:elongation factor 1-beta [Candidatus Nanohaloarchaeota archaeon QJJ-7]
MGEVAVVLKVMPEDTETELEGVKENIEDKVDVQDLQEEEVAFGLKALKVSTIVDDSEGGTDAVENAIAGIEGVRSVEVEDLRKL